MPIGPEIVRYTARSGGSTDWYEESGVVRVVRVTRADGTVTDHPDHPDLGICLAEGMPRDLWEGVLTAWDQERERRRGYRWSCQAPEPPTPRKG